MIYLYMIAVVGWWMVFGDEIRRVMYGKGDEVFQDPDHDEVIDA